MRMLKNPELKKIMGFPEDYVLVGSQADQKKFIGNAVEVTIARALCEVLAEKIKNYGKEQIYRGHGLDDDILGPVGQRPAVLCADTWV